MRYDRLIFKLFLLRAAERGVQVIVVVEYVNFFMKRSLVKELKAKGGILIKPNPVIDNILKLDIKKAWNRYHQKVTLVDKNLFIGSINSSDEYSGFKYGSFQYVDLNIFVLNSPCVGKVLLFFKEILEENKRQIKKVDVEKLFSNYLESESIKGEDSIPVSHKTEFFLEDRPPSKSEIQDSLFEILESAQDSITIIQAYYLKLKKIEDILLRALKRGVKIKIITAAKRDQQVYKHLYNEQLFESLLKNGAEIYEFLDKSFHMKAYCVDNKILTLGSFNNDITSFAMNNEANYLVKRNEKNSDLFENFDKMASEISNNSRRIYYTDINKLPRTRLYLGYFFYFFVWLMEKTVPGRKIKYNN